jgi:hypothetical protein
MRLILTNTVFVVVVSTLVGCSSSQSSPAVVQNQNVTAQQPVVQAATSPVTASSTGVGSRKIDACSLLTAEEVRTVQGEPFKETKASEGSENGMGVSQCFFNLPTFANSVSLAVMRKGDGSGARNPREFWEQTFERASKRESEKERDKRKEKAASKNREEEEEGSAPQKVDGVGDEAFWTGNRVGGALYVLKRDSYIRVSVGGAVDKKTKIEKSKALAQMALKRLG